MNEKKKKANNGKKPFQSQENFGTLLNGPRSKSKLTKDGLVFKNDLMSTDITSQNQVQRKLKGA